MPRTQAPFVDASGAPIPEEQLSAALAEGKAHIGADEEVRMKNAAGEAVIVKGSDVGQALAAGWGIESQAALAARDEQDQIAARQTPLETAKTAVEADLRGKTFGLSDAALTALLGPEYAENARQRKAARPLLAGALETGGAVGTSIGVGALTGGGAIPSIGRAVATGAAEGAAFDAGMEISKASLEQRELTADKLLVAAGHGALLGGGGALVLGAGASALSRAGRFALNEMAGGKGLAESVAAFATKRQLGARAASELVDEPIRAERVMAKMEARGLLQLDAPAAAKAVTNEINTSIRQLGELNVELARAGASVPKVQLVSALDQHVADLRKVPLNEFRVAATELETIAKPLAKLEGDQLLFGEVFPVSEKIGALAADAARKGHPEAVELLAARDTLDAALSASADATPHGPAFRAVLEDIRDLRTAKKILADKPEGTSVSDLLTGALAAVATGSPVAGAATAFGRKLLRDKAPAMVARVARELARVERRIENGVAAVLDGKPLPKRGAGAATAGAAATASSAAERKKRFDETFQQIRLMRTDPVAASKKLADSTADLADWSPEVAEAVQQRVIRGAQFLESRMPLILQRASLTPLAEKTRIPPLELRAAVDYIEALDDPLSIFDDLAAGKVPRRKIEAIREVAPDLYQELRKRVLMGLAEREEPIPYNRRIMLSLAFDITADKSLEPGYLARIQQAFVPPEPPEAESSADIDADSVISNLETQTQRLEGTP